MAMNLLDVPEPNIEKTNVYVVVKDVADLQGNLMASPAILNLYVYRNPLRWNEKRLQLTANHSMRHMSPQDCEDCPTASHNWFPYSATDECGKADALPLSSFE